MQQAHGSAKRAVFGFEKSPSLKERGVIAVCQNSGRKTLARVILKSYLAAEESGTQEGAGRAAILYGQVVALECVIIVTSKCRLI